MPKMKTHKATLKRVKVTATGKVLVRPTGSRHMMSGKPGKSRRHMRRARPLKAIDAKRATKSLNRPLPDALRQPRAAAEKPASGQT